MGEEHLINLQPGTVIAGRYEVVKCIGAGSMGVAYACRHRELGGHLVGVKVLFPEVAQDRVAAARFRNEIFASYRVSHPNVVRAYEYIRDGDLVAYTMEYVGGGDLASKIGRGKTPLQYGDIVKLLGQMCAGVQAIHEAGIVHRDLKPENILLSKEGHVKIADFGIARVDRGQKLTEHGGVVGTIDYVSPEYMLNSQVDWRSDIYALGILAYEMITGELPFRGDSVYAAMTKRLKSDARPPSQLRNDCAPELDAIILRMMARNPDERYQSAAEVFADLQKFGAMIGAQVSGGFVNVGGGARFVGPSIAPEEGSTDSGGDAAVEVDSGVEQHPAHNQGGQIMNSGAHSPRVLGGSPDNSQGARAQRGPKLGVANPISGPDSSRYSRRAAEPLARSPLAAEPSAPRPPRSGRHSGVDDLYSRGYSSGSAAKTAEPEPAYDFSYDPDPHGGGETYFQNIENHKSGHAAAHTQPDARPNWIGGAGDTPTISANPDNLRKLSQLTEVPTSSLWVDVVILIATVVIGLGFGFACVNFLLPGNGNSTTVQSEVSSGLGNN